MKSFTSRVILLLVPMLWFACATTTADATHPTKRSWKALMEDVVGPAFELDMLPQTRFAPEDMDLQKIAVAAHAAADAVALGYGPLEKKDVPGFADLARGTEQWLRQIEAQAEGGQAAATRTLIKVGEEQHCDACHRAAGVTR